MKLKVKLTKEDFLVHQLYTASQSELIRRKRMLSRYAIPILYIGAGVYFYLKVRFMIAAVFLLIAVFWFLIYPFYSRGRYKRQFKKHVEENYKKRVNVENELIIEDNFLKVRDEKSESKISINEVTKLIELIDHFLIQLNSGLSIIIPKTTIPDSLTFKREFESLKVSYSNETNWKWK